MTLQPTESLSFCSAAPVLIVGEKLHHRQVALGVLKRSTPHFAP